MASWHRFDLVESSYAIGLMAHITPAWRERYIAILDQLIERHTGWWSAADWLTQFGHDPDQADDHVQRRNGILAPTRCAPAPRGDPMDHGVVMFPTAYSIAPGELAQALEARGSGPKNRTAVGFKLVHSIRLLVTWTVGATDALA